MYSIAFDRIWLSGIVSNFLKVVLGCNADCLNTFFVVWPCVLGVFGSFFGFVFACFWLCWVVLFAWVLCVVLCCVRMFLGCVSLCEFV